MENTPNTSTLLGELMQRRLGAKPQTTLLIKLLKYITTPQLILPNELESIRKYAHWVVSQRPPENPGGATEPDPIFWRARAIEMVICYERGQIHETACAWSDLKYEQSQWKMRGDVPRAIADVEKRYRSASLQNRRFFARTVWDRADLHRLPPEIRLEAGATVLSTYLYRIEEALFYQVNLWHERCKALKTQYDLELRPREERIIAAAKEALALLDGNTFGTRVARGSKKLGVGSFQLLKSVPTQEIFRQLEGKTAAAKAQTEAQAPRTGSL